MDPSHRTSDRQSLLLVRAAVERMKAQPSLREGVLATLDRWDSVAPPASKPLRDAWRRMVIAGDWSLALDPGELGQQLRQASPLAKALTSAERWAIIRACKGRNSNT